MYYDFQLIKADPWNLAFYILGRHLTHCNSGTIRGTECSHFIEVPNTLSNYLSCNALTNIVAVC